MAKYVKCICNDCYKGCMTNGTSYKTIAVCGDTRSYLIVDDYKTERWVPEENFEESYDVPETITFSSQQEFEDAVMKVVLERLQIQTKQFDLFGRKITNYYNTSTCFDKEEK
jgi:hypothetical protein